MSSGISQCVKFDYMYTPTAYFKIFTDLMLKYFFYDACVFGQEVYYSKFWKEREVLKFLENKLSWHFNKNKMIKS